MVTLNQEAKRMRKRIKGFIKNSGTTGESALVGKTGGYHATWDAGRANDMKKRQRISGINRPST
ncbi:hypothetical protein SAMN02745133_01332 [Desulforamulus putei DSM 12395]|uniref:Uncharacterized protein n=2 Tax=Desulforamulus putei TaxID=74701 RepID=A0A1M4X1D0_9FIRM|nr:hypothetical protein SAMN02745133_01332 [Desulforamulus putei DSM 12395]